MSCPELLDALSEAALGGEANLRLRAHLAACSQCRSELDRLRALTGAIDRSVAAMVTADPSPGFAARIRARVAEESASRIAWWRGGAPAVAGGVAALREPAPPTVEEVAASREFERRLAAAIEGLPEKLRMVLTLAGIEEHNLTEVSRLLGIPEGTVKSRLHLARKRLTEVLR